MLQFHIYYKKLSYWYEQEVVFSTLFVQEAYSFWLDSSKVTKGVSRFSYMGDTTGELSKKIHYRIEGNVLTINGKKQKISIFDYLEKELLTGKIESDKMPFDFIGGFIGYFGYELQAECGSHMFYQSVFPDAYFFFIDRFIAFDHKEKKVYMVCITEDKKKAKAWFEKIGRKIGGNVISLKNNIQKKTAFSYIPARDYQQYLHDIQKCQEFLKKGESYQICLTNQITAHVSTDWLLLY